MAPQISPITGNPCSFKFRSEKVELELEFESISHDELLSLIQKLGLIK